MEGANGSDLQSIEARVEGLERRISVYRWSVIGLLAAALGYWGIQELSGEPVTVRKIQLESQEVKLVDAEGNTRFFMRLYSQVPILQLIDKNGKPRMSLGLRFDDTPFIDLSGRDGETRAVLEVSAEDEPTLRLLDGSGNTTFKIN